MNFGKLFGLTSGAQKTGNDSGQTAVNGALTGSDGKNLSKKAAKQRMN